MALFTEPRQVRLVKCALRAPGLSLRASSADDASIADSYGFDIIPYVQRIDIYESIFQNTISGSITLLENVGLVEYLPIVGVETLTIVFSVEDSTETSQQFARSFRISKVHRATYPRHDWRLYTMEFVTHEFVVSMSQRICRPFRQVTCQAAVTDIVEHDLSLSNSGGNATRFLTNEPTFDLVDVLVPNYTPLKAINYFSVLAQTHDTKESNFLFFETLAGFHFTSVKNLIQSAPSTLRSFEVNPALSSADIVSDLSLRNAAMRFEQDQSFDLLSDIASGTLRAQMVHFDVLARKIEHSDDSRYTETFAKTTHLDAFPVYPHNFEYSVGPNVRLFTIPSNAWTANSAYVQQHDGEPVEQRLRESVILRNRQMREIQHIQTLLDIPGQPDLRAGSIINVNYPSTRTLENKANVRTTAPVYSTGTPYHSGKHLLTSVHHILTTCGGDQLEYRMNLRACRDSLGAPLIGTSATT